MAAALELPFYPLSWALGVAAFTVLRQGVGGVATTHGGGVGRWAFRGRWRRYSPFFSVYLRYSPFFSVAASCYGEQRYTYKILLLTTHFSGVILFTAAASVALTMRQPERKNKGGGRTNANAHGETWAAEQTMENYTIVLTNGNGDIISTETEAAAFVFADNGKAKNTIYETAAALVESTPTAAAFRVYPLRDSLLVLRCMTTAARVAANKGGKAASVDNVTALTIDERKAAAAKAANKASKQTANAQTNATQTAIDNDLRRITAATLAALCSPLAKAAAWDTDLYIYGKIATANAHTQDFFSVGMLAALENANATPTEKTAAIYKAANAWIYANKAASVRDVSTEWIIDGGGDLVSFGTAAAAAILKGGERWQPTAAANMDTETAAALGETLAAAFATITPTQRKVALALVKGYSQRQTAAIVGRSVGTIGKHVVAIRKAFAEYIAANAPQFSDLVRQAETAAAAKAAAKRDTTAAERMRRYRERKAAAKAAALATANK